MLSIYPVAQDFGDEDETNYETDEINKENMCKTSYGGFTVEKVHLLLSFPRSSFVKTCKWFTGRILSSVPYFSIFGQQ